jgi:hypothetical protein
MTSVRTKEQPFRIPTSVKIRVGILHADAAHESGVSVGAVAQAHEFGDGVPMRSFVRAWFDENAEGATKLAVNTMRAAPQAVGVAAELAAAKMAAQCQNRMAAGIPPDLEEATKRARERHGQAPPYVPLIETGTLKSHVVGDAEVIP